MSFREKSAWIFLISIALVSVVYFLHLPWTLSPPPLPYMVQGLFYCLAALAIIEIVGHVIIAVRAPEEARSPRDERERMIDLRATRVAYWVYVVGSLSSIALTHYGANGAFLAYSILFAFVVGEVVKHALRIYFHRRGF